MPSRIKERNYMNNYCEIDGTPCIRCQKCKHLPNQSSKRSHKWLIVFVIAFIIIFVLLPLYNVGIQKHNDLLEESQEKTMDLEERVNEYNSEMSADERAYRNYTGIGDESIGDNYNSMG